MMNEKNCIQLVTVCILLLWTGGCSQPETLFGENGDGWYEGGEASWRFENGEIIGQADGENGWLMTNDAYSNFELTLEFYPDSTVNSGVFIRCAEKELSMETCYEINIWDLHPNQSYRTGSVVSKQEPLAHVETIGHWNAYRIRALDGHIQVWVNDVMTADYQDNRLTEGFIAIQAAEKGTIRFREVRITRL